MLSRCVSLQMAVARSLFVREARGEEGRVGTHEKGTCRTLDVRTCHEGSSPPQEELLADCTRLYKTEGLSSTIEQTLVHAPCATGPLAAGTGRGSRRCPRPPTHPSWAYWSWYRPALLAPLLHRIIFLAGHLTAQPLQRPCVLLYGHHYPPGSISEEVRRPVGLGEEEPIGSKASGAHMRFVATYIFMWQWRAVDTKIGGSDVVGPEHETWSTSLPFTVPHTTSQRAAPHGSSSISAWQPSRPSSNKSSYLGHRRLVSARPPCPR